MKIDLSVTSERQSEKSNSPQELKDISQAEEIIDESQKQLELEFLQLMRNAGSELKNANYIDM